MSQAGSYIKKRNIWIVALACAAATLALSTVHPAPSPSWRFYAAMPGLYLALIFGWLGLAQSFTVIFFLAFLVNTLVYYALIRLVLFMTKAKTR